MNKTILAGLVAVALVLPISVQGQVRADIWTIDSESAVAATETTAEWSTSSAAKVETSSRSVRMDGHPWLRTLATVAASAGGYALADELVGPGTSDVRYEAIAAGAGAGALAGLIFSNAHPLKVIAGAALSALPSAALSTFLAGSLDDTERGSIPLVAFTLPQGLLTSAFAQDRR